MLLRPWLAAFAAVLSLAPAAAQPLRSTEPAVLPRPSRVSVGPGTFTLTPETVIVASGDARAVADLFAATLAPALGRTLPVIDRSAEGVPVIRFTIDAAAAAGSDGYRLVVSPAAIEIAAPQPAGLFYGTQTLRQLLPPEIFASAPVARAWTVPQVAIEDAPRFGWRGLLLDVARHYYPPETIRRYIDLAALHKLNVLQLHLTDDQGWRMEIRKYPQLTRVGAWRRETRVGHEFRREGFDGTPHGGFYTQSELRALVAYAAQRFVTIVPEIEMPGHAQAAIAAYPELGASGERPEVWTQWGISAHLFSPSAATMGFLQDVLAEVMTVFPSRFIHIGGDEVLPQQWEQSPAVQARMRELGVGTVPELRSWFIREMAGFLAARGRRLVGWDEILEGGLAPGATVMSWRGIEGGLAAARAGHDVVMSPSAFLYFNFYQTHDPADPLAHGSYLPLDKVYGYEPVPAGLDAALASRILGAQGALWTEYIKTETLLDYQAFPRTVALAEVTWTDQARRDFDSFRSRLAVHEARLAALGVRFRPVARFAEESGFAPRPELRPRPRADARTPWLVAGVAAVAIAVAIVVVRRSRWRRATPG